MSLIVILDDRVTNRNIFAKLAASIEDGAEVRAFGDPLEALAWLRHNVPDLVISDFKMPNLDGAEFTRAFREIPACADVPVIVITVNEERSHRMRALESGATDFLQSPVDYNEFLTRARNLLKMRKQQLIIMGRAFDLERELADSERSREQAVRDSRERLAQVIDTVPAMISAADSNGHCVFVNAYKASFYGLDPGAIVGKNTAEAFGAEQDERSHTLDRLVFETGNAMPAFEEEIPGKDGGRRVLLTTKSPLRDAAGRVIHVLTTSLDITDRKRAESHLLYLAHHDTLTDLPNRAFLHDRMRREIVRARRGDRQFALHLIDLDRFKGVNDALGHHVGDRLLKDVATRLRGAVRDIDTVARLGGDEFAILQTDLARPEDAVDLAQRVIDVLARPFALNGQEVTSTASIGITVHPNDGDDVDELLRNADLAMYQAKAEGRNAYRLFAADMNTVAREAIVLETDLRHALERQQFVLYYQPQIELKTGRIVGAEALLRWQRPGVGLVKPAEFLPLAEENGLIVPINEWVLREACNRAKAWGDAGLPPLRVAVNLSPVQFRRQDIRQHVTSVLADTGLDPSLLELELTESILMQNTEAAAVKLRELQALGVTFAIDDFGTGYSSLAYVKNFPVDRLKIDQCFLRNLIDDPNDAAIVRTIINLGHSLGLKVVAEGVESAEQLEFLRNEGCDEVQGYYFSEPVNVADFAALIRRHSGRSPAGETETDGLRRTG
jgi:diguanylate cyclase (GGDEF)-like protein/PAS domain S-box-containing protein